MSQSSSRDGSPEIDSEKVLRDVPSILDKTGPLLSSYTYHSPTPAAAGPYILGVDEAGRGPVLGPLVYGVAYCPVTYREQLDKLGFAGTLTLAKNSALPIFIYAFRLIDSKTLTSDTRASLLNTLSGDAANLGWSVRVLRLVSHSSSGATMTANISYAALGIFRAVWFADIRSI
jgi:ribonuclease H2 subunit A